MITQEQIPSVIHQQVYDSHGQKIGEVRHVYIDDVTGRPEWLGVHTGMFGSRETFVPTQSADIVSDHIEIGYDKNQVKDAPSVEVDEGGHLSPEEEGKLYRYYHLDRSQGTAEPTTGRGTGREHAAGRGTGREHDEAMTRSEERLRVGTEKYETGRARLRKYVVTEEQQVSVPVSHEEVRVEREPITEENLEQAMSGPEITESEHEVTLHAERPVVHKETTPVERVRMTKEEVSEEQTVSGEVRKERIDVESDEQDRRRRRNR